MLTLHMKCKKIQKQEQNKYKEKKRNKKQQTKTNKQTFVDFASLS